MLGQCQIEIVAAENEVIAYGHAMELHLATLAAPHADQRKIGRAAADIAYQNLLAGFDRVLPIVLMRVNPGVKSGLRFFDQYHPGQTRHGRRFDGQFPRYLVKRSR
jgi:hypothetical protein